VNTHDLAGGIASLGRYGDSTLVHVSPREVAGLERLAGRRMTTNPHTGMKEAFSFEDMLPAIAGIGVGIATGNPLLGAAAAGVTKAGVSKAQGNDTGSALMQGVITGATSYAAGSALSGIGEAADVAQAGQAGTEAGAAGAGGAAGAAVAPAATTAATTGGAQVAGAGAQGAVQGAAQAATPAAAAASAAPAGGSFIGPPVPSDVAYANQPWADKAADIGRGLINPKILGSYAMEHPAQVLGAAGAAYDTFGGLNSGSQNIPSNTSSEPSHYHAYAPYQRQPADPGPGYRPGIDPEPRYFAAGGGVSGLSPRGMPSHGDTMGLVHEAQAALTGRHPQPERALSRFTARFGPHALTALQRNMRGGPVRGPGGGLDDGVPATINGQQPAKLSDGEYVIPSDAVSHLGDGSTAQGIRQLDGMVGRVRAARTGTTRPPGRTPPTAMPA
jgi:hypothetical protein